MYTFTPTYTVAPIGTLFAIVCLETGETIGIDDDRAWMEAWVADWNRRVWEGRV